MAPCHNNLLIMSNHEASPGSINILRAQFNEISVENLFKKYSEIGFLYPEKLKILLPFIEQIKQNWQKLNSSPEELLWILSINDHYNDGFASVSVIKQSNYGLLAQHLVSNGNPYLSLKVMLDAQYRAEHLHTEDEVRSSQNWFRPNNRYAYRVFSTMYKKIGNQAAFIKSYDYLHFNVESILPYQSDRYRTEEVTGVDDDLIDFVKSEYSNVFVKAEELDQKDIILNTLNNKYKKYNLSRYRRISKVIDTETNSIIACVIANRSPLGLNFSFLENRCYYITQSSLKEPELLYVLAVMNNYAAQIYEDFALGSVPIVTDAATSSSLQKLGANFIRIYVQSIWLREGFSQWYEHIESFLAKIESRFRVVA